MQIWFEHQTLVKLSSKIWQIMGIVQISSYETPSNPGGAPVVYSTVRNCQQYNCELCVPQTWHLQMSGEKKAKIIPVLSLPYCRCVAQGFLTTHKTLYVVQNEHYGLSLKNQPLTGSTVKEASFCGDTFLRLERGSWSELMGRRMQVNTGKQWKKHLVEATKSF